MGDVEARGVRFHVRRLGSGDPVVVLLHGLIVDSLAGWYFTVAGALARESSVVLYDLRGHGRSERPPTGYAVDDMVADLDALLDALGLEDRPVELVGTSFGGLLALAFAIEHPQRVRGLGLVDANLADEAWGETVGTKFRLEGEARQREIEKYALMWAGGQSERRRKQLIDETTARVDGITSETTIIEDLASTPPIEDDDLSSIACPVLAIYGEESDLLDRAERLRRHVPDIHLRLLPGSDHFVLFQRTREVRDVLLEWIRRPPRENG